MTNTQLTFSLTVYMFVMLLLFMTSPSGEDAARECAAKQNNMSYASCFQAINR